MSGVEVWKTADNGQVLVVRYDLKGDEVVVGEGEGSIMHARYRKDGITIGVADAASASFRYGVALEAGNYRMSDGKSFILAILAQLKQGSRLRAEEI